MPKTLSQSEILQLVLRISIASVVSYYSLKWMFDRLDPTYKSKKKARDKAEHQIKRLGGSEGLELNPATLNDHELVIASHLVVPDDITVSWDDIAGLDGVIEELRESVVLPIRHRHLLQNSQLWEAPKGVLLHGPPGCGKTLIAKATAKEGGMRFINLDVAILTDKWYGESQKLASAVFTLASKLQPCIVFIDEIESFLRSRNVQDHEATAMMKTQFMMLWDGLSTKAGSTVIVMGATNRPQDLDKAIMRRMPAQFHVGLPTEEQRLKIFRLVLSTETFSDDVDLNRIAKLTHGFSGSDIRELCRNASVFRIRNYMRNGSGNQTPSPNGTEPLPPISMDNLLSSFNKMKESRMHTGLLVTDNSVD
ncbi:Outer mitochondrial transmembrane helix translocase [Pseudolycoriella hygida]|uniref:Outer mitochondrial transmembrane helix translocase n=1 Tax=Pseudolycoriella hygida TaxID=35572 RepID=A0A9Q0MNR4_9DIPT|nr:Outer mitochondrial transmembrane helix translocase [Pseudolycoriella hygida]